MFDFLIDDAVEALQADFQEHGSYQASTIKELKVTPSEVNPKLKELGLPLVPSLKEQAEQAKLAQMLDIGAAHSVTKANNSGGVGKHTRQRTAISYILDYHDKRPIRSKLKDINVTTHEYQEWLKEAEFHSLMTRELQARFKNVDIDAHLGLSRLVLDGDLNAIKYYFEFTGKYRPNTETQINITVVLAKLMDVLVRHVDSEVLDAIANSIETEVLMPLGTQA